VGGAFRRRDGTERVVRWNVEQAGSAGPGWRAAVQESDTDLLD